MPFQAVPNVAQCTVQGSVDAQLTINDLYFEISGGGITPFNLGNLVASVDNWANATLAPLLSDDWSYTKTRGVDLTTNFGPVAEQATPTVGGTAGEAAPNNVAACVSLRTANRGRSGHGRNFVPAIPNSLITLNTLDTGFVSAILNAYNTLVGGGTFLAGWQLVIVSRRLDGSARPTGLAIPVTEATMTTPYVKSMRSREVGHGA